MRAPVSSCKIFSHLQSLSRWPLLQQLLQRMGSRQAQARCLFEWQRKHLPLSHKGAGGLAGAAALKPRPKAGDGGARCDLEVTSVQGLSASSRGAADSLSAPAAALGRS
jgi:hypothetical protein